jgi:hypothetical protein
MIRLPDFDPSQWANRPAAPAAAPVRGTDTKDASGWFDVDSVGADVKITGDVSLAARGLSVEQHAARVLQQLCGGEPDPSL